MIKTFEETLEMFYKENEAEKGNDPLAAQSMSSFLDIGTNKKLARCNYMSTGPRIKVRTQLFGKDLSYILMSNYDY